MPTPADVPDVDGMPMFGLGTWENKNPDECANSVKTALEMGYRHIDTAQVYKNETAVGEGIAAADVPREDIFLATKVWISRLGEDRVFEETQKSLDKLGTEYVDLLYVHWPAGEYDPAVTLPAFERLREEGLIRHIGVSNFEPHHVERAREVLDAPIFANQVEIHPFLPQQELREFAGKTDLPLVAYSPLARGGVLSNPTLSEIAEKHGVSEPQVSLAWLRQQGITAIPKATSEAHIRDNWESLSLTLEPSDMEAINAIERRTRTVNPDFGPDAWKR